MSEMKSFSSVVVGISTNVPLALRHMSLAIGQAALAPVKAPCNIDHVESIQWGTICTARTLSEHRAINK